MGEATDATPGFKCNICGAHCLVAASELHREVASCEKCGSTPRARAIIRALSLRLFGQSIILTDFPVNREICGLGMSDWEGYAARLAEKFRYTNTYYHKEPRLDISKAVSASLLSSSDFVISSEVFEHIVPPVTRAFQNTFEILKPGGVFILTVPYANRLETVEHFPDLYDFTIVADKDTYRLKNVTRSGEVQEFHNLVFHGGAGATLEMRVFGEAALLRHLAEAGFEEIIVHREPDLRHGVYWPEPWSLPISARRPR
jgi:SAM-dependent methyltransferase